jgi:hemolysin activation/secretion protein
MALKLLRQVCAILALALCMVPGVARAMQTQVDRADPSVVEDQLRKDDRARPKARPSITIARPQAGFSDIEQSIVVGAIRVQGATTFPPSAFAHAIEPYVGRTLAPADLQALASDVADVARSKGYGLATAWIPQQRVASGVLTVMLDEGRIEDIQVVGNALVVRRSLAPLIRGGPVRTAELERQLLIAGDAAGVRIGKVRLDRRGDRNVLVVEAVQKRVETRAYVDNWGSSTVGPVRARLSVDFNGLLSGDDQLTVGGVVTPLQPKEFALVRAAYTKPIGFGGTEIGFGGYYAYSEPGGVLSGRNIDGRSVEAEASIRHPLVRSRSGSLWGSADLRLRDASQKIDGIKARDDRLVIAGANLFAVQQIPNGRLRGRLGASRGLGILDATRRSDPLASRTDAGGKFTKLEAWAEYEQQLGHELSLLVQTEGQVADRPLLSSEEMGLGGRSFGRAWDYREFSGDRGVAGSVELRYDIESLPRPIWMVQPYLYADAGKVSNDRGGGGGGSLASAGGGVRIWLHGGLEAGVEAAFPLTDGFDPAAGRDPRFSFMIGGRF